MATAHLGALERCAREIVRAFESPRTGRRKRTNGGSRLGGERRAGAPDSNWIWRSFPAARPRLPRPHPQVLHVRVPGRGSDFFQAAAVAAHGSQASSRRITATGTASSPRAPSFHRRPPAVNRGSSPAGGACALAGRPLNPSPDRLRAPRRAPLKPDPIAIHCCPSEVCGGHARSVSVGARAADIGS
jgi:hypothetical protein